MLRLLLFPFSVLYDLVTRIRNYLYDHGYKPSAEFDVPVIAVGNLTVGGTGKTPAVEYLIRKLSSHYKIATLSRGYGRNTKGFRIAGPEDNAETLGDEPLQLYQKYGDRTVVTVGEDRAFAIPNILQEKTDIEVVLLDDAFQHRRVKPMLNILLSDYTRPFYKDFLLPGGRLRESAYGARRADVVVVTKCPAGIPAQEMLDIETHIRHYVQRPVFFTSISYGSPIPFNADAKPAGNIILLTGIANARPLREYIENHFTLLQHIEYRDHHSYSEDDLKGLLSRIGDGVSIITTEKDKVKLGAEPLQSLASKLPLFYLPITMDFIKGEKEFDELIFETIRARVNR